MEYLQPDVNARTNKGDFMGAELQTFPIRHIGPSTAEQQEMLKELGFSSMQELVEKTIPKNIFYHEQLGIGPGLTETQAIKKLKSYAAENQVYRSYIGMGYADCICPPVVQRNILENPGWYTQYTPYQAEISQGRLEALLNFQTMVADLTGLPLANASLLDEGTAAAEAMALAKAVKGKNKNRIFVDQNCHPQTIEVLQTRAEPLAIEVHIGDWQSFDRKDYFAAVFSNPGTNGDVKDFSDVMAQAKEDDALSIMVADILSLCLLKSPAEMGAEIAVGTCQRFGLGYFYGGPHAAYFATTEEYKRLIPGRIVGVSKDQNGKIATRLALQTREQHIRRARATSNICTAQVLLAVVASMYAVYHGPEGLKHIATEVHNKCQWLKQALEKLGLQTNQAFFDGLRVSVKNISAILQRCEEKRINLRSLNDREILIQIDEATSTKDLADLYYVVSGNKTEVTAEDILQTKTNLDPNLLRRTNYLEHPNFNSYHSETNFLRYVTRLQKKDLSLNHSMIPLGSCTMKLNATSEMLSISWPEFAKIHPFAPLEQAKGYQKIFQDLENWLAKITGFAAISLQPNAGSQGEYAGLLCIRAYHQSRGESQRKICLIPNSAHGTNPASAVMAGMQVVSVDCDSEGNIDLEDLKTKAAKHKDQLAALMITYPSTHGVFEESVKEVCATIHEYGGQVYLDGANMNAQVGLCRPGDYGADVCHLNLHKTFAIPHGGGGPGVGPIGVKAHLKEFLPGNRYMNLGSEKQIGAISAAPWGSAIILNISWAYIAMMGDTGLRQASEIAILNANYMAKKLSQFYPILFKNKDGLVAHECIVDTRILKKMANIEVSDIAKRLMDYGFHSPTMSWPVIGTLMIEPTESESKEELDRFCAAMLGIFAEAKAIEAGDLDSEVNPLKMAPHTADVLLSDSWDRPYSRELAAYPVPWVRENKFWPSVSRVDDAYGDRNLVCTCPGMDEYA